jgi:CheY-like chemotaxis protein
MARASGLMTNRPILLVEDDRDIREILAETLEEEGFDVVTAENGRMALDEIRGTSSSPSAILLDLMMPVMDGYAFLEERRRDPALASIPVAIITAGDRVDMERIGGIPILAKPIDVPQLIRVLRDLQEGGGRHV